MTQFTTPTGIEHLSEQELQSLYARIYADLVSNEHSAEEEALMTLALQRVRTVLLRKRPTFQP